jgi:hypothetical protein
LFGDVTQAVVQGMVAADLVAGTTATTMDGVEIVGNCVSVLAEGADNDMIFHLQLFTSSPGRIAALPEL